MRRINEKGLELLKQFEQCRLKSYRDQGGVLTIGWGHTGPEVVDGMVISQDEADDQLEIDLQKFYHLDNYLTEKVNDNQYSALIVLAFNIGLLAVKLSTLLKKINNGDNPDKEWLKWNHVHGVVSNGLTRRRKAELELFHA